MAFGGWLRRQLTATAIPPVFASNMGDDDYLR